MQREDNNLDIRKVPRTNCAQIDKTIEKYLPRKFTKDALLFKVAHQYTATTLNPATEPSPNPIWDILSRRKTLATRTFPTLFVKPWAKSRYCLISPYTRSHPQRAPSRRRHRRLPRKFRRGKNLQLQTLRNRHSHQHGQTPFTTYHCCR